MATVSIAESITETIDPDVMFPKILRPAMEEAMELMADAARENLEAHQSRLTGTALWWTDKAKERAYQRRPLIESIRVSSFVSNGEITGFVFVQSDAAHIGRFLEWGTEDSTSQVYGNYIGRGRVPYPFLRPAYENNRLRVVVLFRKLVQVGLDKFMAQQAKDAKRTEAMAS